MMLIYTCVSNTLYQIDTLCQREYLFAETLDIIMLNIISIYFDLIKTDFKILNSPELYINFIVKILNF
jgi:hypothetical protein